MDLEDDLFNEESVTTKVMREFSELDLNKNQEFNQIDHENKATSGIYEQNNGSFNDESNTNKLTKQLDGLDLNKKKDYQVYQKTIRISSSDKESPNYQYFNDLIYNSGTNTIQKVLQMKQYNDPIIDALNQPDLFSVIKTGNEEFYIKPFSNFIIQFELKYQQKQQLNKGSNFLIGDTLFELYDIKNDQLYFNSCSICEEHTSTQQFNSQFSSQNNSLKIGRKNLNFLKCDKFISRDHAEVIKQDNTFYLLKTNINANKVWFCLPAQQQKILQDGQNIRIGLTCERQISFL